MHFDLFEFEDEMREIERFRFNDYKNEIEEIEIKTPKVSKSKLENEGVEILERLNLLYIIVIFGVITLIAIPIFRKSLSSLVAIGFTLFFQVVSGIATGGSIALIILNHMRKSQIIKQLQELSQPRERQEEKAYNTRKNYTTIEDTRKELENLIKVLPHNEEGKQARYIIDKCLSLLERITNLHRVLKIILERSEEYSLEEVISTVKQAGEKIGTNIFNITNRLALELNIEGFDIIQIQKYLDNNEEILAECTKLAKEALNYIESKDDLSNNTIGIESLTETIQNLKRLNKEG